MLRFHSSVLTVTALAIGAVPFRVGGRKTRRSPLERAISSGSCKPDGRIGFG